MQSRLKQTASTALVAGAALWAGAVQAQGAVNLPHPVPQCITCHGMSGLSNIPDAPHLAGQPRIYLVAQMKAFRSGSRQHAVMNVIAKPLTDEDIEVTADWFSAVTLEVRKP
jgi:cytochrome c553